MRWRLATLGALWAACGATTLDVGRYDRSCAAASDCAPVYVGEMCAACACPNAAINAQERSRYTADAKAARTTCPGAGLCAMMCPDRATSCSAGTCALAP